MMPRVNDSSPLLSPIPSIFLLLLPLFHLPTITALLSPFSEFTLFYPYQETLNSLHFFDEGSGVWLPMPLSWERHAPTVAPLITEIQVIYLYQRGQG
jgi:hypothetical protein